MHSIALKQNFEFKNGKQNFFKSYTILVPTDEGLLINTKHGPP